MYKQSLNLKKEIPKVGSVHIHKLYFILLIRLFGAGCIRRVTMGSAQGTGRQSTSCSYVAAAERSYAKTGGNIADMYAGGCGDCGGVADDGSYLGGNKHGKFIGANDVNLVSVKDYANTLNSSTKSAIVKELIEVGKTLGLLKNATGDDSQLLAAMAKAIPAIKADPAVHKETCKRLAAAINLVYGNTIIDPTLPAEAICAQVVEILLSLTKGMHSEFLMIHNDAKRIIANLHVLRQALEADRAAILEKVSSSDDNLLSGSLGAHTELYKILLEEVERQTRLLENLLNIDIKAADADLAQLLKHDADLKGVIGKIDIRVGSDKFSEVIRQVLNGIGVTANFAIIIDNALKTVGMKMSEYANMETVPQLRERLTSKAALEGLNDEQLHKYLTSAELLYENLYRSKDIAAATTSGAMEFADDNIADMYAERTGAGDAFIVATGADEYHKSPIDKRVEDHKKLRMLIFNAFYRKINELFNSFIGTLDIMTMKIGTEIPLSDQLNTLRLSLSMVNGRLIRNREIYHALVGYYNDALSKSKKEQLLNELKSVLSAVDTIIEMAVYAPSKSYFVNIKNSVEAMINLIAEYSNKITAKFGANDFIVATGANDFIVATGGDLYEPIKHMYVPAKNINDAIRQFDYKYREAKIRQNLEVTKGELAVYSENYENLVAQSIADILRADKIVYDKLLERVDDVLLDVSTDAAKQASAATIAEAKAFLKDQWEVKQKFWDTIEAVDSYMRAFTDGLVKDPNAIRDIKAMLSDIEVINDWYNDATGNNLAAVFENFPAEIDNRGGNVVRVAPNASYATADGTHPYEKIANANAVARALPGNPYLVAMPADGIKASAQAKSALGGLAVLKNLLSVFSHLGSTFAGKDIAKQNFMRPTAMYNNFMEYLRASAFAQGFGLDGCKINNNDFDHFFYDGDNVTLTFDPVLGTVTNTVQNTTYVNNVVNIGVDLSGVGIARNTDTLLEQRVLDNINANLGATLAGNVVINAADAVNNPPITQHTRLSATANMDQNAKDRLFRKRWGVWMRSVMPAINAREGFSFAREDEYFVLALKSIAAKILTVVGMYDVFDRPYEFNGLSPIRMIIGGSDTPKVEDAAVALYLRLPLLAQFYRGIFGYDDANANSDNAFAPYDQMRLAGNANLKISMVPDVDGVFSGLIRFIFRRSKNIETGSFSDEDVRELVREVNLIYQKMAPKHSGDVVMGTINALVTEMNRRYAIVTKEERDKYEAEIALNERLDYSVGVPDRYKRDTDMPTTDYAILPGEGDEEVERKSAARKLLGDAFEKSTSKKNPYTITIQHKALVDKFRCSIDKYFESASEEYSFDGAIKAAQTKLKHETNDEARLKIISGLVRGVDIYNAVDSMKYVLFEETVVGGLNMLSVMHTMLARFKHIAQLIDLKELEKIAWKYLEDSVGAVPDNNGLVDAVVKHARDKLKLNVAAGPYRQIINDMCVGFANGDAAASLLAANVTTALGAVINADLVKGFARAYANESDSNHQRAAEFIQACFSGDVVLRIIMELVGAIGSDFQGLLGVRIEDKRIIANTGGLKSLIEEMFSSVSYFIDLLRSHIAPEIFNKYVDKLTAGSFYWLQEQIMEKIIVGRANQTASVLTYQPLDEIFHRLSYTYGVISVPVDAGDARHYGGLFAGLIFYDNSVANSGVIVDAVNPIIAVNPVTRPIDMIRLSGLPGKRMLDTRFAGRFNGLYDDNAITDNKSLLFMFNQLIAKYIQSFFDPITGKMYLGCVNQFATGAFNAAIGNHEFTYPDTVPMVNVNINSGNNAATATTVIKADDLELNPSRVDATNGALPVGANLIISAIDASNVTFVTDAINNALGSNNFNNNVVAADVRAFGSRADPDSNHVLFTSLAVLLKNMLTNKTESSGFAHIHDNIADVPIHMREKMRANLPAFKNLFRGLISRAENIKKFAAGCNLSRGNGLNGTINPWPAKLAAVSNDSSVNKDRFIGIVDSIITGCTAIITCCDNTLREVGDDAKYFEVYQGSIRDYRAQYNIDPFMPLSSTMNVFKNINAGNVLDMFPMHNLGDDHFKMMYGTRALIGNMNAAVLMEHVPGFANIIDKYNLMSDAKAVADKSRASTYLSAYTKMLRYAFEARHIKGLLSNYNLTRDKLFTVQNLTVAMSAVVNPLDNTSEISILTGVPVADKRYATAVYALEHSVSDIIRLTESSLQEDKIKEFVSHVCAQTQVRNNLELQNIVDLNIVPISVHALAREIPLINLYNYAYTFDRLIVELYYGLQDDSAKRIISSLYNDNKIEVGSAKDMLVALLLNPYRDLYTGLSEGPLATNVNVNLFDQYAKGMLLGQAENSELGRPKFLSDQVYNKMIFGSVYDDDINMNELGPVAGVITAGSITAEIASKFAADLINRSVNAYKNTIIPAIADRESLLLLQKFIKYMISIGHRNANHASFIGTMGAAPGFTPILDVAAKLYAPISVFINSLNKGIAANVAAPILAASFNAIVARENAAGVNAVFDAAALPAGVPLDPIIVIDINSCVDNHVAPSSSRQYLVNPAESRKLQWITATGVNSATVAADIYHILHQVGRLRFDTIFVRNLIFITNLYRSVRMKLARDLTYSKDVITKATPIVNNNITEFYGNNSDSARRPYDTVRRK